MTEEDPYRVAGDIRRHLRAITDFYDAALTPARQADESGALHHGASAGEPVPAHALDVRREAHSDLTYWVRFVLDEVNDGTITTRVNAADITALATFLDRWALALAEQLPDDADNLRNEAQHHATALRTLVVGGAARRIKVTTCPEQILTRDTNGMEVLTPCGGTLFAVLLERDNGMLPAQVTCDREETHTWEPSRWRDLGRKVGATGAS